MLIRRSTYVHLMRLGGARMLVVHAMSQLRLVVDEEVGAILGRLRRAPATCRTRWRPMPACQGIAPEVLAGCLGHADGARPAHRQGPRRPRRPRWPRASPSLHGRDAARPGRGAGRAPPPRQGWRGRLLVGERGARGAGPGPPAPPPSGRAAVRRLASCRWKPTSCGARRARRGVALRVATSFPDDLRLAAERPHDVLLVGAAAVPSHGGLGFGRGPPAAILRRSTWPRPAPCCAGSARGGAPPPSCWTACP